MRLNQNNEFFFLEALAQYTNNPKEDGEKLIQFCEYIKKSNKIYNLTSITDINDMLVKHILDSLSIQEFLKGRDILDVGAGAGLPGIPLAITIPKKNFLLVDSNNKKITFLNHVKMSLELKNVNLLHKRVEDLGQDSVFDTVICRSFASLRKIFVKAEKQLKKNGIIVAMKGKYPEQELKDLGKDIKHKAHIINVPGLKAERHAIIMYKK
tara:strand:- start:274 stop:903 length:630 start_codon:yes stop_codon:yes gene_type:complete